MFTRKLFIMKRFILKSVVTLLSTSIIFTSDILAQDCKVLLESISGSYEGDCKKGLANGKGTAKGTDTYTGEFKKGYPSGFGTYTWSNGEIFEGEFKKGLKEGKGKLTVMLPGGGTKDQEGYWLEDEYFGANKDPYRLQYRSPGVLSVRFSKTQNKTDDHSALFIEVLHQGKLQPTANFDLSVRMGSFTAMFHESNSTKVQVNTFPFGFTLNYMGESVQIDVNHDTSWKISIDFNK